MAVTADDVKRVAKTYLTKENRTAGLYYRKSGTSAEAPPPEMSDVPAEMRPMVTAQMKALKEKLDGMKDAKDVEAMLTDVRQKKDAAPEPFKKIFPCSSG